MKSDKYYLDRCAELASLAEKRGDSPVGALIVIQGIVVSEAIEANKSKNDVTCHAEIEAIREVFKSKVIHTLEGAIMYSSHEPCVMCSYVIRYYKISKVVFQHYVPYLGGISSSMPLLVSKDVPKSWGDLPEIIHYP